MRSVYLPVMFFSRCLPLVLLLCGSVANTYGSSGDSTAIDSLAERRSYTTEAVVVSASRWAERATTVSRQVVITTTADVRLRNPGTSADMLESTGEVFVQRSQQGGGSPRLRGFAANSVLMVVDGIRMNNAIYRSGNLQNLIQIDANSLQSTEVLFGPGSVQYGSDALGGAIVLTLKQPSFSRDSFAAHASSMIRFGSAANERTVHADVDLQWTSFATHTSVTATSFGDLRSGSVFPAAAPQFGLRPWYVERIAGRDSQRVNPTPLIQVESGYDQLNVLHKMRYALAQDWTVQYTGLFTTSSNIPRYDRLVELRTQNNRTLPRSAEWYYGPQTWLAQAITVNGLVEDWWASNVTVVAGHQLFRESRNSRSFNSDWLRSQQEDVSILTFNADVQLRLSERPTTGEVDLYYGVEVSHQNVASLATERSVSRDTARPAATRYPDGGSTYTTLAAYAQLRWDVLPTLTLSGGLRATSIALRSTIIPASVFALPFSNIEMNPAALTGSIGVSWRTAPSLTVRANLATGFRAPNVDDAAKVFEAEPGRITLPNPTLGPVYVTTAEGGIEVAPAAWCTLRGTLFRSWLSDALEKRLVVGADSLEVNDTKLLPVNVQNVGTARLSGVHLSAEFRWNTLLLFTSATYTTGRDETNDVPLEHVVPAFGITRLSWRPTGQITFEGDVRWSAAWLDREIAPADRPLIGVTIPVGGQPAWTVAGVRVSAGITYGLTLTAGVENMFDVHYRTAQSGISAPGRNVVVALRWN